MNKGTFLLEFTICVANKYFTLLMALNNPVPNYLDLLFIET